MSCSKPKEFVFVFIFLEIKVTMFAHSNGINPHNALCSFPFETTAIHFCVLLVILQFPCSSLCYFAHHPENLHFKYHLFKLSLLLSLSLSLCAKLKTI